MVLGCEKSLTKNPAGITTGGASFQFLRGGGVDDAGGCEGSEPLGLGPMDPTPIVPHAFVFSHGVAKGPRAGGVGEFCAIDAVGNKSVDANSTKAHVT